MNSDKASDVAASINGCPSVASGDDGISQNYPADDSLKVTRRGVEWNHTGECFHIDDFHFSPARIHQAGEIAVTDQSVIPEQAPRRPVFEVIVPALNIPESHAYIPQDIVFEAAKHDCLIRALDDGSLRLRDDLQGMSTSDSDGDRCANCGCTRFRLRDSVPVCERCGNTGDAEIREGQTTLTEPTHD